MRVLIIGATGRNGRQIVARADAAGHQLIAFAPDPAGFAAFGDRVTAVAGDVLDPDAVKKAVTDCDAVVFALGPASRRTTTLLSDGIRNTIQAMEAAGVRRLVCVSTSMLAIGGHLGLARKLFSEFVIERIMRNVYLDLARMEDEVELCDLDYTVVRSAPPTDGPLTGSYRVAAGSSIRRPGRLSRADLADYIVRNLETADSYRAVVEVAY